MSVAKRTAVLCPMCEVGLEVAMFRSTRAKAHTDDHHTGLWGQTKCGYCGCMVELRYYDSKPDPVKEG